MPSSAPRSPAPAAPPAKALAATPGRSDWQTLGALFAAIGAFDTLAVLLLGVSEVRWPNIDAVPVMALGFAQLGVAAVILAWGPKPLGGRVALASVLLGAAIVLVPQTGASRAGLSVWRMWAGVLGYSLMITTLPLAVLRLLGVQVRTPSRSRPAGPRQFSLWRLMTVVTLAAVGLGGARQVAIAWPSWAAVSLLVVSLALLTWTAAALLVPRLPWIVVAGAMIAAVCLASAGTARIAPTDAFELAVLCAMQGVLLLAALGLLRASGWRLALPASGPDPAE